MIHFAEARAIVLSHLPARRIEHWSLDHVLGRVLAEDVMAQADSPRFDCSSVDGFAIGRNGNLAGNKYLITDTIVAGNLPSCVRPGQAARILTGAVIPESCDAVVMKELCDVEAEQVVVSNQPSPGENIRRRGEEFKCGDLLLPAGTILTPGAIGLLAANGVADVTVFVPPRVALITTGNEVVELGTAPKPGQIYNANRWSLLAALQALNLTPVTIQHARDFKQDVMGMISTAQASADIIITAGGVSVGETDFLRPVMRDLGWKLHFDQIAIKPGKPTCFATRRNQLWFGLPGNPVAALLSFHHFVRPVMRELAGNTDFMPELRTAKLTNSLAKKHDRLEFVRGRAWEETDNILVDPHARRESHMLSSLVPSNCLIHFPEGTRQLETGESVQIEFLPW